MKISKVTAALLFAPTIYRLAYVLFFVIAFASNSTGDGSLPIFGSVEVLQLQGTGAGRPAVQPILHDRPLSDLRSVTEVAARHH